MPDRNSPHSIDGMPAGLLQAARMTCGAKDEYDTSKDAMVLNLSNRELIARYSQWNLGARSWGITMFEWTVMLEADTNL